MQTDTAQGRKSSLRIMEELIYDIKDIWNIDPNP